MPRCACGEEPPAAGAGAVAAPVAARSVEAEESLERGLRWPPISAAMVIFCWPSQLGASVSALEPVAGRVAAAGAWRPRARRRTWRPAASRRKPTVTPCTSDLTPGVT
jgi:hypothetical protein